jgi:hypothetical protein
MSVYPNIVFLHLAGMAGLFIGYGLEWVATARLRQATTGNDARLWLGTYRLSLPLSGPALLLLILTGGYLAGVTGSSKEGWIVGSLLGIAIALVIGFGLVMPAMKRIKTALPEGNAALTGTALSGVQDGLIVTLIRVRAFLALGIVYLMVVKPALILSCGVLLIAIGIGALCSLGVRSKLAA